MPPPIQQKPPLDRILAYWHPPVWGARLSEEAWRDRLRSAFRDWLLEMDLIERGDE